MKKNQRKLVYTSLIILATLAVFVLTTASVHPVSYGASDVIAAVNSLRAEYGLAAYTPSGDLNEICQQQADYMASINTLTHDREDGSAISTTAENIAYGPITRAMDSWVDDQPHFNTLTAWSSGQVGAGVAETGSTVYICLNIKRYSDSKYVEIPFSQEPGTTPLPTIEPTEATVVEEVTEEVPVTDEEDNGDVSAETEPTEEMVEATPVAVLLEEDELQAEPIEEAEPTDEPVEIDTTSVQPQEIAFESSTGKIVAYVLMGIGALGLAGSIYGMIWAIKAMGGKKKPSSKKKPAKKPRKKNRKGKENPTDSPNEAQEE